MLYGIAIAVAWFFFLVAVQTTIQVQRLEPNTTPTALIWCCTVSSASAIVVVAKLVVVVLLIIVVLMIIVVMMRHGPKTIDKVSGFDGRPTQIQDLQTAHRSNAFLDDGRWAGRQRNILVATRIRIRIDIRIGIICIGPGIRVCVISRTTTVAGFCFCCKSLAIRVAFLVEQAGWKRKSTVRQGPLMAMVSF